jgi:hypothetical protein
VNVDALRQPLLMILIDSPGIGRLTVGASRDFLS